MEESDMEVDAMVLVVWETLVREWQLSRRGKLLVEFLLCVEELCNVLLSC